MSATIYWMIALGVFLGSLGSEGWLPALLGAVFWPVGVGFSLARYELRRLNKKGE